MSLLDNLPQRKSTGIVKSNNQDLQKFDLESSKIQDKANPKKTNKKLVPKTKGKVYTTYLSSDLIEKLNQTAKSHKVSANEIIKQALNEFLENY